MVMGLLKCTDCGRSVSERALTCPGCGNSIFDPAREAEIAARMYAALQPVTPKRVAILSPGDSLNLVKESYGDSFTPSFYQVLYVHESLEYPFPARPEAAVAHGKLTYGRTNWLDTVRILLHDPNSTGTLVLPRTGERWKVREGLWPLDSSRRIIPERAPRDPFVAEEVLQYGCPECEPGVRSSKDDRAESPKPALAGLPRLLRLATKLFRPAPSPKEAPPLSWHISVRPGLPFTCLHCGFNWDLVRQGFNGIEFERRHSEHHSTTSEVDHCPVCAGRYTRYHRTLLFGELEQWLCRQCGDVLNVDKDLS